MQHTFLYISFPSLHDCGVKIPNFTFMEDVKKRERILLPLSKLECGPQEINSREIRLHLQCQQIGISATKFEKREFILKVKFSLPLHLSMLKLPIWCYEVAQDIGSNSSPIQSHSAIRHQKDPVSSVTLKMANINFP